MTKGYFASTIEKYYLLNSEEVVTSMREKLKSESSRYQNRDQFLVYPNGNINFSSIDELAFCSVRSKESKQRDYSRFFWCYWCRDE